MIYYLIGPMGGYPGLNAETFMAFERRLRAKGHEVINNGRRIAEVGYNEHTVWTPEILRVEYRVCLAKMEKANAGYHLPDWRDSKGANFEHAYCVGMGYQLDYNPREKYDPEFGDNELCICSAFEKNEEHKKHHTYYRHFDSYDDMSPVGCKYCVCDGFTPLNGW